MIQHKKSLVASFRNVKEDLRPYKEEMNKLNALKDEKEKECGKYKSIEQLDGELISIKEKLGFGNIDLTEEKKLYNLKNKLEEIRPSLAYLNNKASSCNTRRK